MRCNYHMRSTLRLDQRNHGRSKNEELIWTRNCTDELVNPSIDLKMRKRENLPVATQPEWIKSLCLSVIPGSVC